MTRFRRRTSGLSAVLLVCLAAGCASDPALQGRQVVHVVVCWLKDPGGERELINVSREFRTLPGVIRVQTGRPIPSDRPVVDDSFDVAIVMTFRDEAALRAYEASDQHQRAVRETLQPLVKRFVVYDLEDYPLRDIK